MSATPACSETSVEYPLFPINEGLEDVLIQVKEEAFATQFNVTVIARNGTVISKVVRSTLGCFFSLKDYIRPYISLGYAQCMLQSLIIYEGIHDVIQV